MLARPVAALLSIAWIQGAVGSLGFNVPDRQRLSAYPRALGPVRLITRAGARCAFEGAALVSGVRIVVASRADLAAATVALRSLPAPT